MKKLLAALTICGLIANTALSDLTYSFRFNPVFSGVTPTIPSSVDLFLDETSTDIILFPLRLSNASFGLATGNANVTLNTAQGTFNSATPNFVDDGVLTIASGLASGSNASITQTTFENPLLSFSLGNATGNVASIKLGKFDFTITGVLSSNITTNSISLGDLVLGDIAGTDLSGVGVSQGIFNFTAVPEPASLGGALILFGSWFGRRKSRKARKVDVMKDFE